MLATPRPRPIALRIELLDIAPLIWRRVLVSNQWTLASLHNYLQWVMGWMDTHTHEFHVGAGVVAPDWWIHEVSQDSDTENYRDERRVSVAGENACPPDDVGGPHGYALFLEIIGDRNHEQHEDMVRWIGGVFDPKGFDLNRLNRDWKGAKARRR